MILGADPGFARCGWAVVEPRTGRVAGLGVILTEPDPHVIKRAKKGRPKTGHVEQSTDRARRVGRVGAELAVIARDYGVTSIAAEQALGHGAAAAVAANMLPWGALVQLAVMLGIALVEVKAKTWQHAVLGVDEGAVDYEVIEKMLARYAGKQAAELLGAIKKANRTHALDGMGVGMLAALRPAAAVTIVKGRI